MHATGSASALDLSKTLAREAVRIPETVSRKALAAGGNTAHNRRLAPCRSQEQTYPDSLPGQWHTTAHITTDKALAFEVAAADPCNDLQDTIEQSPRK